MLLREVHLPLSYALLAKSVFFNNLMMPRFQCGKFGLQLGVRACKDFALL
jgi:hypothetical protein